MRSFSKFPEDLAITNELRHAGVVFEIDFTRGSHYRIRWRSPDGLKRTLTALCSSSDWRARRNARADARRLLRADGLIR
jgi:hypothetical protein